VIQLNLGYIFLESSFAFILCVFLLALPKLPQEKLYWNIYVFISYMVPRLYIQIEHKLPFCCHFNYRVTENDVPFFMM
jgi:hypothetical protein